MSDDWLWLFEVNCGSAHGRASDWLLCPKPYQCLPFLRRMACASIGLCANRGAADGKLVLIHDVQSYIYTIASPVAVVLASTRLSPWLLASAMIHPAQSLIARSFVRQCFGTVGLDRRDAQWGIAES